jgi:hypothetical protein
MRELKKIAVLVSLAAVLAPAAGATSSRGFSERGLAAYGATLTAEAAAYRSPAITPAGLDAYGRTLQAEARAYRTAAATRAPARAGGFSWQDAGLGAGVILAGVLVALGVTAGRVWVAVR